MTRSESIQLSADQRKQALASIRRFIDENWDQDIGELKASLLLDYMLREIGPSVYNQAIGDAQAFLRDRVADLEGTCYYNEFTFGPKGSDAGVRRKRSEP